MAIVRDRYASRGVAAAQGPAIAAVTYEQVAKSELNKANGLKELMFPLASVLAPVLAGLLYAPIGLPGIILVDLVTFAIAVAGTVLSPISVVAGRHEVDGAASDENRLWKQTLQGFAYISRRKGLFALVIFMAVEFAA